MHAAGQGQAPPRAAPGAHRHRADGGRTGRARRRAKERISDRRRKPGGQLSIVPATGSRAVRSPSAVGCVQRPTAIASANTVHDFYGAALGAGSASAGPRAPAWVWGVRCGQAASHGLGVSSVPRGRWALPVLIRVSSWSRRRRRAPAEPGRSGYEQRPVLGCPGLPMRPLARRVPQVRGVGAPDARAAGGRGRSGSRRRLKRLIGIPAAGRRRTRAARPRNWLDEELAAAKPAPGDQLPKSSRPPTIPRPSWPDGPRQLPVSWGAGKRELACYCGAQGSVPAVAAELLGAGHGESWPPSAGSVKSIDCLFTVRSLDFRSCRAVRVPFWGGGSIDEVPGCSLHHALPVPGPAKRRRSVRRLDPCRGVISRQRPCGRGATAGRRVEHLPSRGSCRSPTVARGRRRGLVGCSSRRGR